MPRAPSLLAALPGRALPLAAVLAGLCLARLAPALAQRPARRSNPVVTDVVPADAAFEHAPPAAPRSVLDEARPQALFERLCAPCHGLTGGGDGALASFLSVPARNLRESPFKWRSTPSGAAPTVDDVALTVARGVPGGVMPSFGASLSAQDRALLARYVLAFRPAATPPAPWLASPELQRALAEPTTPALRTEGAALYARLGCPSCHGDALRGDGPGARAQPPPPYDLTRSPARGGTDALSLARTLRTGLDGTSMPAYETEVLTDAELATLVRWLRAQLPEATVRAGLPEPARWLGTLAPEPIVPAPTGPLRTPGLATREAHYWDAPLAPQGEGPPQLTPAERSLAPQQCARCHAAQFEQFRTSVHAAAMGPGVRGQLLDMDPATARGCQRCHGPLDEQFPSRPTGVALPRAANTGGAASAMSAVHPGGAPSAAWAPNPDFSPELHAQGVVCAACHLRGRERYGPPLASPGHGARLPGMYYPLTVLSRFERGDFCAPCHQLPPSDAIGERPALDTVAEWYSSSYFARGIQCQHCHMPDREHRWRGAHDPDTVRQAVTLALRVTRESCGARAEATLRNVGAGHAFPGTTTPAAVLELQWLDAQGRALGAAVVSTVQRHLVFDGTRLVQQYDTRILPGAERRADACTQDTRARSARATLTFRPDDYYEGFYAREVNAQGHSAAGRALLQEALAHARSTPFVVHTASAPVP